MPQDQGYHAFADTRRLLGVANFANVASNAGFLLVGGLGLAYVPRRMPRSGGQHWPWRVLFAGVLATGLASGYYHLAPDDGRLAWDRLAMTVALMGLFAGFLADRIDARVRVALPLLVAAGIASVLYWIATQQAGHGDLRAYGLVQFYPALAIPLICWLYPGARTDGRHVAWALLWYALAKLAEHFDAAIFRLAGETVSGHTLKHLLAAAAVFVVLRMLQRTSGRA